MKNIRTSFLLLFLSCSILMVSCAPEDTSTPTPTDVRDNVIGTYSCEETENASSVTTFDINIRKNTSTTDGLIISNFYNIGSQYEVNASYSGSSLTIASQTVNGFKMSGSGSFNGTNKINFTYSVQAGGNTSSCTAVATQQ